MMAPYETKRRGVRAIISISVLTAIVLFAIGGFFMYIFFLLQTNPTLDGGFPNDPSVWLEDRQLFFHELVQQLYWACCSSSLRFWSGSINALDLIRQDVLMAPY